MFQLLLAVCINSSVCQYDMPPLAYETLEVCSQQAALIAGLVSGQHPPSSGVTYRFRCQQAGQTAEQAEWIAVDLAAAP